MAQAGALPSPTPQTNLDHSYWKDKLPRSFQLYIDRLARGLIRVQPSNGPEFAAVLMEELLAQRTRELNNLPEVSYLATLKDKVQRRGYGGPVQFESRSREGRESAMSSCSCCGRTAQEIQCVDEDCISQVSCICTSDRGEGTCVVCMSQEEVLEAVANISVVKPKPKMYSCHVQTQDPGQDAGTQVCFGMDAGTQMCPVHTPSPEPTPVVRLSPGIDTGVQVCAACSPAPSCPVHSPRTSPSPTQGNVAQTQTVESTLSPQPDSCNKNPTPANQNKDNASGNQSPGCCKNKDNASGNQSPGCCKNKDNAPGNQSQRCCNRTHGNESPGCCKNKDNASGNQSPGCCKNKDNAPGNQSPGCCKNKDNAPGNQSPGCCKNKDNAPGNQSPGCCKNKDNAPGNQSPGCCKNKDNAPGNQSPGCCKNKDNAPGNQSPGCCKNKDNAPGNQSPGCCKNKDNAPRNQSPGCCKNKDNAPGNQSPGCCKNKDPVPGNQSPRCCMHKDYEPGNQSPGCGKDRDNAPADKSPVSYKQRDNAPGKQSPDCCQNKDPVPASQSPRRCMHKDYEPAEKQPRVSPTSSPPRHIVCSPPYALTPQRHGDSSPSYRFTPPLASMLDGQTTCTCRQTPPLGYRSPEACPFCGLHAMTRQAGTTPAGDSCQHSSGPRGMPCDNVRCVYCRPPGGRPVASSPQTGRKAGQASDQVSISEPTCMPTVGGGESEGREENARNNKEKSTCSKEKYIRNEGFTCPTTVKEHVLKEEALADEYICERGVPYTCSTPKEEAIREVRTKPDTHCNQCARRLAQKDGYPESKESQALEQSDSGVYSTISSIIMPSTPPPTPSSTFTFDRCGSVTSFAVRAAPGSPPSKTTARVGMQEDPESQRRVPICTSCDRTTRALPAWDNECVQPRALVPNVTPACPGVCPQNPNMPPCVKPQPICPQQIILGFEQEQGLVVSRTGPAFRQQPRTTPVADDGRPDHRSNYQSSTQDAYRAKPCPLHLHSLPYEYDARDRYADPIINMATQWSEQELHTVGTVGEADWSTIVNCSSTEERFTVCADFYEQSNTTSLCRESNLASSFDDLPLSRSASGLFRYLFDFTRGVGAEEGEQGFDDPWRGFHQRGRNIKSPQNSRDSLFGVKATQTSFSNGVLSSEPKRTQEDDAVERLCRSCIDTVVRDHEETKRDTCRTCGKPSPAPVVPSKDDEVERLCRSCIDTVVRDIEEPKQDPCCSCGKPSPKASDPSKDPCCPGGKPSPKASEPSKVDDEVERLCRSCIDTVIEDHEEQCKDLCTCDDPPIEAMKLLKDPNCTCCIDPFAEDSRQSPDLHSPYAMVSDLPDNYSRGSTPAPDREPPAPINVNVSVQVESAFDSNVFMDEVKRHITDAMDEVRMSQVKALRELKDATTIVPMMIEPVYKDHRRDSLDLYCGSHRVDRLAEKEQERARERERERERERQWEREKEWEKERERLRERQRQEAERACGEGRAVDDKQGGPKKPLAIEAPPEWKAPPEPAAPPEPEEPPEPPKKVLVSNPRDPDLYPRRPSEEDLTKKEGSRSCSRHLQAGNIGCRPKEAIMDSLACSTTRSSSPAPCSHKLTKMESTTPSAVNDLTVKLCKNCCDQVAYNDVLGFGGLERSKFCCLWHHWRSKAENLSAEQRHTRLRKHRHCVKKTFTFVDNLVNAGCSSLITKETMCANFGHNASELCKAYVTRVCPNWLKLSPESPTPLCFVSQKNVQLQVCCNCGRSIHSKVERGEKIKEEPMHGLGQVFLNNLSCLGMVVEHTERTENDARKYCDNLDITLKEKGRGKFPFRENNVQGSCLPADLTEPAMTQGKNKSDGYYFEFEANPNLTPSLVTLLTSIGDEDSSGLCVADVMAEQVVCLIQNQNDEIYKISSPPSVMVTDGVASEHTGKSAQQEDTLIRAKPVSENEYDVTYEGSQHQVFQTVSSTEELTRISELGVTSCSRVETSPSLFSDNNLPVLETRNNSTGEKGVEEKSFQATQEVDTVQVESDVSLNLLASSDQSDVPIATRQVCILGRGKTHLSLTVEQAFREIGLQVDCGSNIEQDTEEGRQQDECQAEHRSETLEHTREMSANPQLPWYTTEIGPEQDLSRMDSTSLSSRAMKEEKDARYSELICQSEEIVCIGDVLDSDPNPGDGVCAKEEDKADKTLDVSKIQLEFQSDPVLVNAHLESQTSQPFCEEEKSLYEKTSSEFSSEPALKEPVKSEEQSAELTDTQCKSDDVLCYAIERTTFSVGISEYNEAERAKHEHFVDQPVRKASGCDDALENQKNILYEQHSLAVPNQQENLSTTLYIPNRSSEGSWKELLSCQDTAITAVNQDPSYNEEWIQLAGEQSSADHVWLGDWSCKAGQVVDLLTGPVDGSQNVDDDYQVKHEDSSADLAQQITVGNCSEDGTMKVSEIVLCFGHDEHSQITIGSKRNGVGMEDGQMNSCSQETALKAQELSYADIGPVSVACGDLNQCDEIRSLVHPILEKTTKISSHESPCLDEGVDSSTAEPKFGKPASVRIKTMSEEITEEFSSDSASNRPDTSESPIHGNCASGAFKRAMDRRRPAGKVSQENVTLRQYSLPELTGTSNRFNQNNRRGSDKRSRRVRNKEKELAFLMPFWEEPQDSVAFVEDILLDVVQNVLGIIEEDPTEITPEAKDGDRCVVKQSIEPELPVSEPRISSCNRWSSSDADFYPVDKIVDDGVMAEDAAASMGKEEQEDISVIILQAQMALGLSGIEPQQETHSVEYLLRQQPDRTSLSEHTPLETNESFKHVCEGNDKAVVERCSNTAFEVSAVNFAEGEGERIPRQKSSAEPSSLVDEWRKESGQTEFDSEYYDRIVHNPVSNERSIQAFSSGELETLYMQGNWISGYSNSDLFQQMAEDDTERIEVESTRADSRSCTSLDNVSEGINRADLQERSSTPLGSCAYISAVNNIEKKRERQKSNEEPSFVMDEWTNKTAQREYAPEYCKQASSEKSVQAFSSGELETLYMQGDWISGYSDSNLFELVSQEKTERANVKSPEADDRLPTSLRLLQPFSETHSEPLFSASDSNVIITRKKTESKNASVRACGKHHIDSRLMKVIRFSTWLLKSQPTLKLSTRSLICSEIATDLQVELAKGNTENHTLAPSWCSDTSVEREVCPLVKSRSNMNFQNNSTQDSELDHLLEFQDALVDMKTAAEKSSQRELAHPNSQSSSSNTTPAEPGGASTPKTAYKTTGIEAHKNMVDEIGAHPQADQPKDSSLRSFLEIRNTTYLLEKYLTTLFDERSSDFLPYSQSEIPTGGRPTDHSRSLPKQGISGSEVKDPGKVSSPGTTDLPNTSSRRSRSRSLSPLLLLSPELRFRRQRRLSKSLGRMSSQTKTQSRNMSPQSDDSASSDGSQDGRNTDKQSKSSSTTKTPGVHYFGIVLEGEDALSNSSSCTIISAFSSPDTSPERRGNHEVQITPSDDVGLEAENRRWQEIMELDHFLLLERALLEEEEKQQQQQDVAQVMLLSSDNRGNMQMPLSSRMESIPEEDELNSDPNSSKEDCSGATTKLRRGLYKRNWVNQPSGPFLDQPFTKRKDLAEEFYSFDDAESLLPSSIPRTVSQITDVDDTIDDRSLHRPRGKVSSAMHHSYDTSTGTIADPMVLHSAPSWVGQFIYHGWSQGPCSKLQDLEQSKPANEQQITNLHAPDKCSEKQSDTGIRYIPVKGNVAEMHPVPKPRRSLHEKDSSSESARDHSLLPRSPLTREVPTAKKRTTVLKKNDTPPKDDFTILELKQMTQTSCEQSAESPQVSSESPERTNVFDTTQKSQAHLEEKDKIVQERDTQDDVSTRRTSSQYIKSRQAFPVASAKTNFNRACDSIQEVPPNEIRETSSCLPSSGKSMLPTNRNSKPPVIRRARTSKESVRSGYVLKRKSSPTVAAMKAESKTSCNLEENVTSTERKDKKHLPTERRLTENSADVKVKRYDKTEPCVTSTITNLENLSSVSALTSYSPDSQMYSRTESDKLHNDRAKDATELSHKDTGSDNPLPVKKFHPATWERVTCNSGSSSTSKPYSHDGPVSLPRVSSTKAATLHTGKARSKRSYVTAASEQGNKVSDPTQATGKQPIKPVGCKIEAVRHAEDKHGSKKKTRATSAPSLSDEESLHTMTLHSKLLQLFNMVFNSDGSSQNSMDSLRKEPKSVLNSDPNKPGCEEPNSQSTYRTGPESQQARQESGASGADRKHPRKSPGDIIDPQIVEKAPSVRIGAKTAHRKRKTLPRKSFRRNKSDPNLGSTSSSESIPLRHGRSAPGPGFQTEQRKESKRGARSGLKKPPAPASTASSSTSLTSSSSSSSSGQTSTLQTANEPDSSDACSPAPPTLNPVKPQPKSPGRSGRQSGGNSKGGKSSRAVTSSSATSTNVTETSSD